ncbi:MAG TPA: cell wall-binding repeat-containing protein [Actinomycetes bacterium]
MTSVSAGYLHTCAVGRDGSAYCWGSNGAGQLGAGSDYLPGPTPPRVLGLSGVTAISAGYYHTCAVTGSGLAYCWGDNVAGELGNGTTVGSSVPVRVPSLSGVTSIKAARYYTCALLSTGSAYCWGNNVDGVLGNGTTKLSTVPVKVVTLASVAALATGDFHACALTRSATGYCWGRNSAGQLGDGTAPVSHTTPVTVTGLAAPTALVAAAAHTCALTAAHTVHCWGGDVNGGPRLGDGTTASSPTPVAVLNLSPRIWDRLAGADRYATAAAVSRSAFAKGGAGAVVLARGDAYPDALVGVPLAAEHHAPLLLTHGTALPTVTLTEIRRVLPVSRTVYILGGTDVVPASIGAQLASLGYSITRYAGADRFATAVSVADALGDPSTVLLASGLNFPDALAAGPAATAVHGAVLLTTGSTLPPVTVAYLAAHPGTTYAIGGPAFAAEPTAQPVLGADRYATAATVAATFFPAPATVGIATGLNFLDALAGGAQLAAAGGPLLLTATTVLPSTSANTLTAVKASLNTTRFYGETDVVADPVALAAAAALGY